ncbi:MAG: transcriptional antiterminator, Rof [Gammaproteobacteria bacterium]|nr:transcriptional antiterminator, Rof [Gammaproteobacteria bacterium]MCP5424656.1 transcriptional antiterminator, Rof [Gammaproteobacteria bacterium]
MDTDVSDYIPIDCELYSRYELAIIQRRMLRLAWRDLDGLMHLETLLPINLETRDHAEYLIFKNQAGLVQSIRLDRIVRFEDS